VASKVPLIHNFMVTETGLVLVVVTSNLAVIQVPAAMAALPVATVVNVAAGLFQ
jgi:hypothetical protein